MTEPTHQPPLQAIRGGRRFRIEFGGEWIGYYLYVYEGEQCTHDYLQDTVAVAQDDALEMFGVPKESWTDADETASLSPIHSQGVLTKDQTMINQAKTFLLVEDDKLDAELVQIELKSLASHATLRMVRDGADAIDYVTAKGKYADRNNYPLPDLILLDLNMPRVNGFEFLTWLRTHSPNGHRLIPVVVMSASNRPEDVTRAYGLGANSYIVKAVDVVEFRDRLRSVGFCWGAHTETPTVHDS